MLLLLSLFLLTSDVSVWVSALGTTTYSWRICHSAIKLCCIVLYSMRYTIFCGRPFVEHNVLWSILSQSTTLCGVPFVEAQHSMENPFTEHNILWKIFCRGQHSLKYPSHSPTLCGVPFVEHNILWRTPFQSTTFCGRSFAEHNIL